MNSLERLGDDDEKVRLIERGVNRLDNGWNTDWRLAVDIIFLNVSTFERMLIYYFYYIVKGSRQLVRATAPREK